MKFFHVKLKVDYITESSASTRPNATADGQERSDYYEYILEVDSQGRVVGGEWLGSSLKDHPDFLWYPQEGGQPITWQVELAKVRELLGRSRAEGPGPVGGIDLESSAYLQRGQTRALDVIEVPGDAVLEFLSTGSGDMDVYVGINRPPTFDARNGQPKEAELFLYEPGSSERKTLRVAKGDRIHVIMRAYEDEYRLEERLALATLAHEVNHLCNGIAVGPTYDAFQDEYRAWYVGFVAGMGRLPWRSEAMGRIHQLRTDPAYPDLQEALAAGDEETARILAFLSAFQEPEAPQTSPAPLPAPLLNLSNTWSTG